MKIIQDHDEISGCFFLTFDLTQVYSRATMDEIALEAEISKPTIYQFAKSKDDLFLFPMLPVVEKFDYSVLKMQRSETK